MKILVIQLTRAGDILCTLPILEGLKNRYPEAEIHFLVRKKFSEAITTFASIDKLWLLDSQNLFEGVILANKPYTESLNRLAAICDELKSYNFDKIINLTFSPSSSFITHLVSGEATEVSGYTRTSDFYLFIPDKPSQYFRSQVGVEKNNRLHILDLFSWISNVELKSFQKNSEGLGVVCHLGASDPNKTWPLHSWTSLLRKLTEKFDVPFYLVGASSEFEAAENLKVQVGSQRLSNLVGRTSLRELQDLLSTSQLFIGADSGPLHCASLAGCPALNLSVGPVRFWETGPIIPSSTVLVSRDPGYLTSDIVFQHAVALLSHSEKPAGYFEVEDRAGVRYTGKSQSWPDSWALVSWLYFDGPQPFCGGDAKKAIEQLAELAELGLTQTEIFFKNPTRNEVVQILDRIDDLIRIIGQNMKGVQPLVDAFLTRKENIPPGPRSKIFEMTCECYRWLYEKASQLTYIKKEDEERK